MSQVWAEAVALWKSGEQWWLTEEEEALRASYERKYRSLSVAEEHVSEYFTDEMMQSDKSKWEAVTCMDMIRKLNLPEDRKTLNEMGHALVHLTGSKHSGDRRLKGKKKAWLVPPDSARGHMTLVSK
jgi:predicted P-loop ATPase